MRPGKFSDDRPPSRDDDDKEKLSWRERDAKNDRKQYFGSDKPERGKKAFQDKQAQTTAKAALNDLFKPKNSEEQREAWKKLNEARGAQFSKSATEYVEKFGLPATWDHLLRLLDHSDSNFILKVLEKLEDQIPNETHLRKELLRGKLRVLKLEREEPELQSKLEDLLHALSVSSAD
jgi:hypothetical protein